MAKFNLEQWFDVSKPITELEVVLTEIQLLLEVVKKNIDPESAATRQLLNGMKKSVKSHNRKFA